MNFYIKKFKKYYGDRKILIAKELTKMHEEFFRENIKNLNTFKNSLKGELTVVISSQEIKTKPIFFMFFI